MKKLIKQILWENKIPILIFMVFIILNTFLLTYPPKIIGNIVDLLYDIQNNHDNIIKLVVVLIVLSFILLIVRVIWKYYDTYIPRKFERDIKSKLFGHFMNIKLSEIHNRKNGEIMSYFVKDISEIRLALARFFSFGTRIVFTLIFAIYAMISNVNLLLTIISMIPLVIATLITIILKNKLVKSFEIAQKEFTTFSEYVQESTDAIRTTKAYSLEENQINEFTKINNRVKKSNVKVDMYSTSISVCVNLCFGLSYGLSLLLGTNLVLNNTITIGDFVAFNSYIGLLVNPISWIPSVISRIKRFQISYKRLDDVFNIETEHEKLKLDEKVARENLAGDIIIKDLTFHYPDYIDTALDNINLEIKQGQTLGIIGKLGSGKTTLMNLIVKLYQVPRNKIFIDNKDINDIEISTLRDNICYITQDSFLFSSTLKSNINLFKDIYKDEEIKESTKKAMIYDEIMELPENIYTVIGERGVDLSGGQKQRVVISRAFLNKCNFVIFDDTFSALDNKTEQNLLKNIKGLVKNKTCIIISNRISDIKHADNIIVLDNGKILETGTHKDLLKLNGTYTKFYKEQSIKKAETILD